MNKVINTEKIPIKLWLDNLDDNALQQAKNLANLPFAYKWVSIMPDSHLGYGMPIGGVLATQGVVIPNAVGVDIGCGMCVVDTGYENVSTENLKLIMKLIRDRVPVGFNWHKKAQVKDLDGRVRADRTDMLQPHLERAAKQIGTLGGGNHFIELQTDKDDQLHVMIHSGSRNLGKQVADYYNKVAKDMNRSWHTSVPEDWDLAFLPMGSPQSKNYLKDMNYCIQFALRNRLLMMERILLSINEVLGEYRKCESEIRNEPHNFARMENHFGKNVMVHRKGATSAREGELGMIPGSQGTSSYIVTGKGNTESFESCSHGSGRTMGRKQAERELNLEKEIADLDNKGILHAIRGKKDLDEAPGAYKDIEGVMLNQTDLVDVVKKLSPRAVIKG